MKFLTTLFLTLLCVSVFTTVNGQDNKKSTIEIDDIVLPNHPDMLLSAKVLGQDHYEINLRFQSSDVTKKNSADVKSPAIQGVTYIVNPFTSENFCRIFEKTAVSEETAVSKLEELIVKENPNYNIAKNKSEANKEAGTFRECDVLFYQLKRSEIAAADGIAQPPIAGKLYVSNTLFIHKSTTNHYNELLNKQERNGLVKAKLDSVAKKWQVNPKKWQKKAKQWKKDSIRLRNAIETLVDLEMREKNDASFSNFCLGYTEKKNEFEASEREAKKRGEYRNKLYTSFLRYRDTILAELKDTTLEKKLRYYFLRDKQPDSATVSKISNPIVLKVIHFDKIAHVVDSQNVADIDNGKVAWKLPLLKDTLSKLKMFDTLDMPLKRYVILGDSAAASWFNFYEEKLRKDKLDDERNELLYGIIPSLERRKSFEYKIESVEIEFNEGFIENILVVGEVEIIDLIKIAPMKDNPESIFDDGDGCISDKFIIKKRLKFENKYPIGFSRKSDYVILHDINLSSESEKNGDSYVLDLRDLLTIYIQKHAVGRRDFSPKNDVISYDPKKDKKGFKILYKEETSKLFEAKVYSDFVGLDGKSANGLLQTEIGKRLNLNTRRWATNPNFGHASWVEPTLTLSKIEQNRRDLLLTQLAPMDSSGHTRYYAATLDVRQHEALRVGVHFNILYWDRPAIKSTFSFNGNVRYGRTPVAFVTATDTITSGINTVSISPEITCDTKADERWGLSLSFRSNWMRILSRDVVQVADISDPKNRLGSTTNNRWYNTAQFEVFFKPSNDTRGQLFFRYRYHWQWGDQKLGFHQAQVGYSFYLLGQNKGVAK